MYCKYETSINQFSIRLFSEAKLQLLNFLSSQICKTLNGIFDCSLSFTHHNLETLPKF